MHACMDRQAGRQGDTALNQYQLKSKTMLKKLYLYLTNFFHFFLFILGIALFITSSYILFYAIKRILVEGSFSNYGASGSQLQIEVLRQGFSILFCIGLVIISILLMIFSKNIFN